jgi:hypothetical protein
MKQERTKDDRHGGREEGKQGGHGEKGGHGHGK